MRKSKNTVKALVVLVAAAVGFLVIAYVVTGVMGLRDQQIIIKELGASTGVEDSMFDENAETDMSGTADAGSANSESKNNNTSAEKPSGSNPDKPLPAPGKMDYESFHDLSPAKQQEYMDSFKDIDAFFKWYNKAKDTYEKENPAIEIGGGIVDLK